jgi:hypothetical protein
MGEMEIKSSRLGKGNEGLPGKKINEGGDPWGKKRLGDSEEGRKAKDGLKPRME